jgi:hypothetical protein
MFHAALRQRNVISMAGAALAGAAGLHLWPFPADNAALGLIAWHRPPVYTGLVYAYATLWFTTPYLALSVVTSLVYVLVTKLDRRVPTQAPPPYPAPGPRDDLFLILGEQHLRTRPVRTSQPRWLVLPERGLYTGLVIVGAVGTGKTSACMYPYLDQILGYRADDPARCIGGLILDVKGDFARHVRNILAAHGRADDYIEVSLDSPYRYNPLHNDLEAYALAYGIATLMTNLFGRGKEPFWQQASTNLVKFVILLHQVLDGYVTLFQIYVHAISPDKLRARVAEGEERFSQTQRLAINKLDLARNRALESWTWHDSDDTGRAWTCASRELEAHLTQHDIEFTREEVPRSAQETDRAARFAAVKRWFEDDWMRIEPKLRTSIVEGISVFLSLFDDNPAVKHAFCPPREVYEADPDSAAGKSGAGHGRALPPMSTLIEQGKVVVLNLPLAMNPGLARAIGTMLKQDFQRAVLNRIPSMGADGNRSWRSVLFMCDEYQIFATSGENEPSGDEKFFSLARQARCIPIVATQSISSLRSTLPGESWRTLLQGMRTKVFLALSDDMSARMAADLCGRAERLKPGYTLTESGRDASVSLLTGRAAAHRTSVTAAKSYTLTTEYLFEPKIFAELQNAQAIVLPYDGLNPLPPTYCYLKPYYLDPSTSYFDHLANGAL